MVPKASIRTGDLPLTRRLLCQLSYKGETGWRGWDRTSGRRINNPMLYLLSYTPKKQKGPRLEAPRDTDYMIDLLLAHGRPSEGP